MSSSIFKIGKYEFGKGASLAPMAGITNTPFRQLCTELGAIFCVTELISCHAVVYMYEKPKNKEKKRGTKTSAMMEKYESESPHIVQLYGRDPEIMSRAAKIVEDEGADIIDLNFGCPARKVIKNGEGCGVALMLTPDLLGEIAQSVVNAVSIPVTGKTRLGYHSDDKNGVLIASTLESVGVKAVTIHARTREQGHSGPVDYDTLKQIVDAVDIPIIGNGGIFSKEDADLMLEKTGCASVAVGQGSKGNPWLFKELAGDTQEVTLKDRLEVCRRHLDLFEIWGGEKKAVTDMRKHACWYLKGFDGAAQFRKQLGTATSKQIFLDLLNEVQQQNGL